MKLCFIADARSPIAQHWIRYWAIQGHEVQVISTHPASRDMLPSVELHIVTLGFSHIQSSVQIHRDAAALTDPPNHKSSAAQTTIKILQQRFIRFLKTRQLASAIRAWTVPFQTRIVAAQVRRLVEKFQPDLVHALRIPYEGILALDSVPKTTPLIMSVWGNDFTLFAQNYPIVGWRTRQALRRVDGLHTDCVRDLTLSYKWGFDQRKPFIVIPGAGGIDTNIFFSIQNKDSLRDELNLPRDHIVVVNPRGFRSYVHNDIFFEAIALVKAVRPKVIFIGLDMIGHPAAMQLIDTFKIQDVVRLTPSIEHNKVAKFFQASDISVSLSSHDGTPNTLLEAMACGSFPLAGNIESIREWITDGQNGILCDPKSVNSVVKAIIQAVDQTELREKAKMINRRLIIEKASHNAVMREAEKFYDSVLK